MAIVTPATYEPLSLQDLSLGSMSGPLDTILANTNHLYKYHRPAMLSVAYMCKRAQANRTMRFTIPALPSADGLIYEFRHKIEVANGVAFVLTTLVETYDPVNGWQNLVTTNTNLGIGTTIATVTQTGVLAAAVSMVRVSYSCTNAAAMTPHHLLVRPLPGDVVTGLTACGFAPYDNGMIAAATGGAVTTEHVNRAVDNAIAILADRAQCAFAWVQEDDNSQLVVRPGLNAATSWRATPPARVGFPGQSGTITLDVGCFAGVTRGSNVDTVRLQQVGGKSTCKFNATGTLQLSTLEIELSDNTLEGTADLEAAVRVNDVLAMLDVFAIVAWWRPTT